MNDLTPILEKQKIDTEQKGKNLTSMDIKPSIIVDSMQSNDESNTENTPVLKEKIEVTEAHNATNFVVEDDVQATQNNPIKPSRFRKFTLLISLAVVILSCIEMGLFTWQVFAQNDWLGGAWLIILVFVLVLVGKIIASELASLKRIRQQNDSRQYSEDLFNTPAIGPALVHCKKIAKCLPPEYQPLVKAWEKDMQQHYTNSEVLSLFELKVLEPIDKNALSTITKHASAAGVMIAVSPFALLDMGIVLWRNIRMINQLSSLYGVQLGYWGRIALIKNIFRHMLYAGAMEILSDAGNYAVGAGITGKISTRIAQGFGAGVLTSRIGLRALYECRPMPWLSLKKPGLTQLTNKVLQDLSRYIK